MTLNERISQLQREVAAFAAQHPNSRTYSRDHPAIRQLLAMRRELWNIQEHLRSRKAERQVSAPKKAHRKWPDLRPAVIDLDQGASEQNLAELRRLCIEHNELDDIVAARLRALAKAGAKKARRKPRDAERRAAP